MRTSLARVAVEGLESRRLLSAGDLDSTFGTFGRTTVGYSGPTDDSADAVAVLPDGKLLVAGESFAADGVPTLSRYLANGQLDTTFGTGRRIRRTGVNSGGVLKLVLNADGAFLALTSVNVTAGLQPVTRYTAQGAVDLTWIGPGTGITGRSLDLVALGGGASLMVTTNTIAKLTANGALDTTFGGGTGKVVFAQEANFLRFNPAAVAIQSDGKIVVAGERQSFTTGVREPAVRRFNPDGTLDTTFADAGQQLFLLPSGATTPSLRTVAIQADQKIVLAGTNGADAMVIRLPGNGGADQAFGQNGVRYYNLGGSADTFSTITIQADGKYLFGGHTDYTVGTQALPRPIAARVTTAGLLDATYAGDGVQELIFPAVPNLYGYSAQIVLDASGRGVLVGTVTTSPHRTDDAFVARLTTGGLLDTTFDGTDGVATSDFEGPHYLYGPFPSVGPDGSVYMGGSTRISAGGAILAKLNPNGIPDAVFGTGNGSNGVRDYDFGGRSHFIWNTTVQDDGKIVAVGRIDTFDFATSWSQDTLVARFNTNGTLDTTFGGGDGYVVTDLSSIFEQWVRVVVQGDGKILTYGQYRNDDLGEQLPIFRRLLPDGTPDLGFGFGDGYAPFMAPGGDSTIYQMVAAPDGKIYVGGITSADRFVQRLNANGSSDADFGDDSLPYEGTVLLDAGTTDEGFIGLAVHPITRDVLVAGTISNSASSYDVTLTKLDDTGEVVSSYGAGGTARSTFASPSYSIGSFIWTPDGKILLGGHYQPGVSDTRDLMVARLLSDGNRDATFSGDGIATVDFARSDDHAGIALRPNGSILLFTDTDALVNGPTLFGAARLQGDATGSITGLVFNDRNNNGVWDTNESVQPGCTVFVDFDNDGQRDAAEPSAATNANGGYTFFSLAPGTYVVRLVSDGGWLQTLPAGDAPITATVVSGQITQLPRFGTRYNFATIYGTIFEDLNNDGVKETGEGPLVGWTGYVDANNNNFLETGELSGVSDQFGIFRIDNVTAGTHQLRVVPQVSWDQTLPAGFGVARSVTVAAGGEDRSSVFGFWYEYNSISGTMFNDANANGVRDTGEGPLSGRTLYLDLNLDFALTGGEPTRVTDANGNYTFDRLLDGTYRVTLVQVPYWRQTPDLMYRSAQVVRGEDEVNVNFSAVHVGRASGQLFNDANGNGVQDGGETTFTGFGVSAYLDLNGNSTWDAGTEPTSYTGGTGQFSFEMLPGTYTVCLKDLTAAGVRQTSPANNGGRAITIVAGQDATVASFGVQQTHALSGQVFSDGDGDGVLDSGEGAQSGRVVWADLNDNSTPDTSEPQGTTDSSGRYSLRLWAGTFRLRQVVPVGYQETGRSATNSSATNTFASTGLVVVPTDTAWTPAPASPPAPSFNFGTRIVPVTRVYGYVIRDNNGNGVTDSGEPGNTPGDVVYVDANNNTALDAGEQQYTTDANGWFFNLPGGTYTIRQSLPSGWVQTMPAGSAGLTVDVPPTTPPNPIHAGFFGRYMLPPQNPFKGSPFAAGATPVTIQAEDYDLGGEGIAFHDTTPTTNSGGGYRTASGHGVDVKLISNTTNQYRLGDTFGGEWVEYTINVATSGQYTFDFRLSQADPNARMHAEIDGVDITGAMTVPDTNNFSTFTTVSRTAFMVSGPHVLRLAFDAAAANGTVAGVDWVKITAASTTPPPQPPTGGTVTINNSVAAYLRNGTYGNTNFGNDAQLIVKNSATSGNTRESYLKFDISTLPSDVSQISNVKLRLYGRQSAAGTAVNIGAFAVADTGWSETGITFNNKPPSATGSMATIRSISGTSNKWYEWDVTDYVKQQRMNGFTTIAIAMKATNATDPQALFNSDDASSNRPQLVATTSSTPPTTPQAIVVDNDGLIVPEGGTKSFTVKLAAAPTSNVTVTISKQAGSQADVNADKSTLTFTPANWNVAQTVTLSAAEDADTVQNQSFFSVSSSGLSTITVWAVESENDGTTSEPTITIGESATVRDGTYATQNFGNGTELVVKKSANAGNTRETYIKFDFSTVESVTTAKLRINARLSDTSVASLLTQIYSVSNTTWAETGITWNTKPTTGVALRGSFTVSGTSATWYEIDLTSFIQAEFAAGRKVVTLVLRNPNTSDAQTLIPSDETPDGPQLVVG